MEPLALPAGITFTNLTTLAYLVLVLSYALFTAIFFYHWREYSTNASVTRVTLLTYFATTLPLLVLMGSTTLYL